MSLIFLLVHVDKYFPYAESSAGPGKGKGCTGRKSNLGIASVLRAIHLTTPHPSTYIKSGVQCPMNVSAIIHFVIHIISLIFCAVV